VRLSLLIVNKTLEWAFLVTARILLQIIPNPFGHYMIMVIWSIHLIFTCTNVIKC
jgi:hypothetical protein